MRVKRVSIVQRVPIILRTPIIYRKPIVVKRPLIHTNLTSNTCVLFSNNINNKCASIIHDCSNIPYCIFNPQCDMAQVKEYINAQTEMPYTLVRVTKSSDLKYITQLLQVLTEVNLPIVLSTEVCLTKEILDILSRNPFNIVQTQMIGLGSEVQDYKSQQEYKHSQQVMEMMCDSKTYGLYVSLRIEPITPRVTSMEQLLSLVSVAKNSCNHFSLRFMKLFRGKNENSDFIYIDNVKVPKEFFQLEGDIWRCSDSYIEKVLNMFKLFAGNLPCTVCGRDSNCFGLPLKVSYNDGGIFYFSENEQ